MVFKIILATYYSNKEECLNLVANQVYFGNRHLVFTYFYTNFYSSMKLACGGVY